MNTVILVFNRIRRIIEIPENLKIEKAYHYDFCMLTTTEEIAYLKSIGAQEQFMECDYFGFKIENKEKENNVKNSRLYRRKFKRM